MGYKTFFATLLLASNAYGWGATGHRVTAEIARRHLTKTAEEACLGILDGLSLPEAANWADEIRDDERFAFLDPFHYANVPKGETHTTAPKNPLGDVILTMPLLVEYLKTGDPAVLAKEPTLKVENRAMALRLLIHLIADLHQPLHVMDDNDQGGNKVLVSWMGHVPTKLHVIWDSGMIDDTHLSYTEYALFLNHAKPDEIKSWQNLDYEAWAAEALPYRVQIYSFPDKQHEPKAGEEPMVVASYKYISKNQPVLERRLLQGGIRLAYLLNWLFDTKPAP